MKASGSNSKVMLLIGHVITADLADRQDIGQLPIGRFPVQPYL
jgi:hypothetical protein